MDYNMKWFPIIASSVVISLFFVIYNILRHRSFEGLSWSTLLLLLIFNGITLIVAEFYKNKKTK